MRAQYFEFIRQQLLVATADLSGATKGQLVAFAENGQFCTDRYKRKQLKVWDEESQKMIAVWNEPVSGNQSRAKGSHIPLVQPIEFATASWRRAVLAQEPQKSAWLLWCYSDDTRYTHQVEIVRWAWAEFEAWLKGKRIAAKTLERLHALIWLAAQDTRLELRKGADDCLEHQRLARLAGVSKSTWSEVYAGRWEAMRAIYKRLDRDALAGVAQTRSMQMAANYQ